MEISSTSAILGAASSQSYAARSSAARRKRDGSGENQDDITSSPFAQSRPTPIKVGFGGDSVKLPNLAASTIKRNLRNAKELIPTLEESNERVRERVAADERVHQQRDSAPSRYLDVTAGRAPAVGAARTILSSVNTAAGEALQRTGQEEELPTNRIDIRIGGTTIPFDKPKSTAPLDLLA